MLSNQTNKVYRTREQVIHDLVETPEGRIAIAYHKVNADPKSRDKLRAVDLYIHPATPMEAAVFKPSLLPGETPEAVVPKRMATLYRFARGKVTDPWVFHSRDDVDLDEFYTKGDPKGW